MRQSQLFTKTLKNISADVKMASHKYLTRGGFIKESVAGRYYFLPLGMRVRDKIVKIIEEEMDKAGAQKLITPVLHPLELWEETNRTNSAGFELMKVRDRRGSDFALGGTAEEMMVDLVRDMNISYRDLPFNIYQFSQKFRDELRARGGLLRVREFLMKDAYSFHVDEDDFKKEYKKMGEVYTKIFKRLGLDAVAIEADNGYIGGEYCHEYVVESDIGESAYFASEDGKYAAHEDVAKFKRDEINMDEKEERLEIVKQPEHVKTIEDAMKHYKLPACRFLKNVVYKNRISGEIIIATIRGDLDVNKTKLERVLGFIGQLEDASEKDLASIGTKHGYVHSWGHEGCRYVGDRSLLTVKNFIGGQKEEYTDSKNVNYGRDFKHSINADIAIAREGDMTEDGNFKLIRKRGIEVGNIFQLGTHYSEKMDAKFTDKDGKEKFYYMGCYGIGVGRNLATIVEKYHDDKGIIWPESVAPFKVHLISLRQKEAADKIYDDLQKAGVEVFYDDREDVAPGEKFADADLIGCHYRVVVSKKTLREESVELKRRNSDKFEMVKIGDIVGRLLD